MWRLGGRKLSLDLVGLALWWAEGGKYRHSVSVSNTDPDAIAIAVRWLREVYGVPRRKFRMYVQVHSDLEPSEAIRFWSRLTGIPCSQFLKPYVFPWRPTARTHKIWFGVCTLRVHDTRLFDYLVVRLRAIRALAHDKRISPLRGWIADRNPRPLLPKAKIDLDSSPTPLWLKQTGAPLVTETMPVQVRPAASDALAQRTEPHPSKDRDAGPNPAASSAPPSSTGLDRWVRTSRKPFDSARGAFGHVV